MPSTDNSTSRTSTGGKRPHASPSGAVAWPNNLINDWIREQIAAAGGDPAIVPDEPFRMIRLPEVEAKCGLTRSSIYRRIDAQSFPRQYRLGSTESAGRA
jgi:predicted DNA-binding transcriptional regulator AlpA